MRVFAFSDPATRNSRDAPNHIRAKRLEGSSEPGRKQVWGLALCEPPMRGLTGPRYAATGTTMMRATSVVISLVAAMLIGAALAYAFVGAGFVSSDFRVPTSSEASPS